MQEEQVLDHITKELATAEQFTSAFPEDPIQDCTIIIDYLIHQ